MRRSLHHFSAGLDAWRATTLGPMRFPAFRTLWIATVVAYFGAVIQTIGAGWQMATLGVSAQWVAFVQAASLLPIVLFALPSGALADIGDRRMLMLIAQIFGAIASIVLVAVALLDGISPISLLVFTLLVGCSSALAQPSWQAAVGDLVDRESLPAAIALNALAFNAARSLGPAIGGIIVAMVGAVGAFALNAISYFGLIAALLLWRPAARVETLPPEPIGRAIGSGLRYAMLSPTLLALFARGGLFGLCAGSVLALLPLVAREQLSGGPLTYGILLGGFGVGSMAAALLTARARQLMSTQRLISLATAIYAAMTCVIAFSPMLALSAIALTAAGGAWILVLATIGTSVQMSCPRWVVGRCVALGQVATIGGMAGGAVLWGVTAAYAGLQLALIGSAGALLVTLLIARYLPIGAADDVDWSAAPPPVALPEAGIDDHSGPIVVTIEYRIPRAQAAAFLRAIREIGRVRQRDGARRWSICQDIDEPEIWRERYQSPTWREHLRRVSRVTAADKIIRDRALQFHLGPAPIVTRMLERSGGAPPLGEE